MYYLAALAIPVAACKYILDLSDSRESKESITEGSHSTKKLNVNKRSREVFLNTIGDSIEEPPAKRTRYSIQKKITHEISRKQVAQTVINYSHVVQEVLARNKKSKPLSIPKLHEGQTDIYFKHMLGNDFVKNSPSQNLESFISNHQQNWPPSIHLRNVFLHVLDEERRHPDSIVFYHAANSTSAFVFDLITLIRNRLYMNFSADTRVFRLFDEYFTFSNVNEFIKYHQEKNKNWKGNIHDWYNKYHEVGLCTNLFLFGNHTVDGEATYDYFMNNRSMHEPNVELFLNYAIRALGVSDQQIEKLLTIYNEFKSYYASRLYQIFVDREIVDEMAYPAGAYGVKNELTSNGKKIESISKIIETLQKNPKKYSKYILKLQARIYLKPEYMSNPNKVRTKVYFSSEQFPVDKYHQKLDECIDQLMLEFLTSPKAFSNEAFAKTPSLFIKYKQLCVEEGVEVIKQVDPHVKLASLIVKGDHIGVKKILEDEPSMDISELPNPDYIYVHDNRKNIDAFSLAKKYNHSKIYHIIIDHMSKYHSQPKIT